MTSAFSWIIFWVLYFIFTPLVFKLYFSKSKDLPSILRFMLIATQIAVLALVFMPWTKLSGQPHSGFNLATEFSYQTIYGFIFLTLITVVLLVIGNPTAIWTASILNIVNSIFIFYMMIKLSGATGTNVSEPAAIIEAFLLLIGNVIAILLASSTKLSSETILGKIIYTIFGQGNYINTLKETAKILGGQYIEPEMEKGSKVVQGVYNSYKFKIYDFQKPVAGISAIGVSRVEMESTQNTPQVLFAFPKASPKYYAYLNNVIQGDPTDPLNTLKNNPNYASPFSQNEGWIIKIAGQNPANEQKIIESIREQFQNVKIGWIVSSQGKIYFETSFMNRPKYTPQQLSSIVGLLASINDLYK